MPDDYISTLVRLLLALGAGALIGFERTYNGHPAGFRTHILVATSSSLLMLMTLFHARLIPTAQLDAVRIDPTRMAQGIMTGIGFLGAGVIVKEGLTIRGLTTAASIWITASIGIMIGAGLYFEALLAEGITLGALTVLRLLESTIPSLRFGRLEIRQRLETAVSESDLAGIVNSIDIDCIRTNYHVHDGVLRYEIELRTRDSANFRRLAEALKDMDPVDFSLVADRS